MEASRILIATMLATHCVFAAHHGPPLSTALVSAKTVYLLNMGRDSSTFDHIYDSLTKWGRWEVVADRSQADLVLAFSDSDQYGYIATSSSVGGMSSSTVTPLISQPRFLVVLDNATGEQLLNVSCERRLTGGATASALINKVRKRLDRN